MAKGWFNKILPSFVRRDSPNEKKSPVPQGLWQSCPNCKEIIYGPDLESNLYVCTNCDHHIRIGARHRLSYLFDEGSYEEISSNLEAKDWLSFKDSKKYKDRLADAQSNIDEKEANEIEKLIHKRNVLKKAKDFDGADAIRDLLHTKGIELIDSEEGTSWKLKS